jgi:hypothetical protein
MTRRERLIATLKGETVDHPPVSFYELNGLDENPNDKDPFNIYNHPSWLPLIELAKEKTDRIILRGLIFDNVLPDPSSGFSNIETRYENGSRIAIKTLKVGNKILKTRTRRDPDINTIWTEEHLLKDVEDLKAFLSLPLENFGSMVDTSVVTKTESIIGESGIVMIDTPDPLCLAAALFDIGDYGIIALTEPKLFHRLLEKFASILYPQIEFIAKELPGRLWRIYGPEYASPPILPPKLFNEYVVKYDEPIINAIKKHGGFARVHSHGNLKLILDDLVSMGIDGLDPIEPPPQGDVELIYVREKYGRQLILFGNLEVSDIENLPTQKFAEKVKKALDEGARGDGRGFVLMPSACPYGRILSTLSLKNYEKIIELVERF